MENIGDRLRLKGNGGILKVAGENAAHTSQQLAGH
jgi:hypothetical protein